MKRSHAPLLHQDFHPTGGNELETVIGDTRGMQPCLYLNETGARLRSMQTVCPPCPHRLCEGSELACLDQAHQDLTHIGLHLESQQRIRPCHALIDGHDGLALLMRCQRKAVTRIHHQ